MDEDTKEIGLKVNNMEQVPSRPLEVKRLWVNGLEARSSNLIKNYKI